MPESIEKKNGPPISHLREKLFLAEQSAHPGLKVLPGKRWALHYAKNAMERDQALSGLFEGRLQPAQAADALKPDALVYDAGELDVAGVEAVGAKIRDTTANIVYYDHDRFAQFIAAMRGSGMDLSEAQLIYGELAKSRTRKKMLDAYGFTGRRQITAALKEEVRASLGGLHGAESIKKVLEALKISWLRNGLRIVGEEEKTQALDSLSGEERKVFDLLEKAYADFTQTGTGGAFESLTEAVRSNMGILSAQQPQRDIPEPPPQPESSSSQPEPSAIEKLKKELEKLMEQVSYPGMPGDTAIPPEDKDEYHTPPPEPHGAGESAEKQKAAIFFEIVPAGDSTAPMSGWYCSGRKSYFDPATLTWSKKKKLVPWKQTMRGSERQTISATVAKNITSIPLPNGYALDCGSLKYGGTAPKFHRDQNGCFYIETTGPCRFAIDFLKENPPHVGMPIKEDLAPLSPAGLSAEAESLIKNLQGDPAQKAQALRKYVISRHHYPGGGDLKLAQALQHKLRTGSTALNYLNNLEKSEYLECYSANTLFIAMLRKAGIPARLVIGHKIDGARDGKAKITETTGHAWSEFWDGNEWKRLDATPKPKPGEKNQNEQKEEGTPTPHEEADDGGVEPDNDEADAQPDPNGAEPDPDDAQPDPGNLTEQVKERVRQKLDSMADGKEGEASDAEMQEAKEELQTAQSEMKRQEKREKELDGKIDKAKSFKELDQAGKETEQEDLLEEIKKILKEKIEAKEEQMKEKIKEELEKMADDGFMEKEESGGLEEELDKAGLDKLDEIKRRIDEKGRLYHEYEKIREEVEPAVENWFEYFADRLPKQHEIDVDEDSLTRQGAFNRHSVMKPRNLLFGTVKNPRVFHPSVKPRFLASILVDVSGSMKEDGKLANARKMLVFYCELFTRISKKFGYIRFSIHVFADGLTPIKTFSQEYDSIEPYDYEDGPKTAARTRQTVKARLMKNVRTQGGTNMYDAVTDVAQDLNDEVYEYPDYLSAFYFIGDGEDTCGKSDNVRDFLNKKNAALGGFGRHMLSAIMLGGEEQKRVLADIFGEENTTVAPDFNTLVEESMIRFGEDVDRYVDGLCL